LPGVWDVVYKDKIFAASGLQDLHPSPKKKGGLRHRKTTFYENSLS